MRIQILELETIMSATFDLGKCFPNWKDFKIGATFYRAGVHGPVGHAIRDYQRIDASVLCARDQMCFDFKTEEYFSINEKVVVKVKFPHPPQEVAEYGVRISYAGTGFTRREFGRKSMEGSTTYTRQCYLVVSQTGCESVPP